MHLRHFEIGEWAVFVRGMSAGEERREMERHLASGCAECRESVEFCRRFSEMANRMIHIDVPEDTVTRARAIFRIHRPLAPPLQLTPFLLDLPRPAPPPEPVRRF